MRISDWSSDVCSSDLPTMQYVRRIDKGLRNRRILVINVDWDALRDMIYFEIGPVDAECLIDEEKADRQTCALEAIVQESDYQGMAIFALDAGWQVQAVDLLTGRSDPLVRSCWYVTIEHGKRSNGMARFKEEFKK